VKETTAKADALQAVIEKTKPKTQLFSVTSGLAKYPER